MIQAVKEKLEREMQKKASGSKASAVRLSVYTQLVAFSEQSKEFAEAILDSEKTINDCCSEVMEGCGCAISDIEVYRKVVAFYFPGSDVEMTLTINLSADAEKNPQTTYKRKAVVLDLFDMFGG